MNSLRESAWSRWLHHRILPSLLGFNQGRGFVGCGGIQNLRSSRLFPQFHFCHSHPEGGESHSSQEVQIDFLCNVIYKIITKVIPTRLKSILPFVIFEEQAGYVEGIQIMDSVILDNEVINSLKTTKIIGMLIKLNSSKSFDRVSWQYLCSMLESFGFDRHWVNWILELTSSTFFYILVNAVPSQPFSPTRGIL
jgi:hypothetical protein